MAVSGKLSGNVSGRSAAWPSRVGKVSQQMARCSSRSVGGTQSPGAEFAVVLGLELIYERKSKEVLHDGEEWEHETAAGEWRRCEQRRGEREEGAGSARLEDELVAAGNLAVRGGRCGGRSGGAARTGLLSLEMSEVHSLT